jgi:hypothetical protein
VEEQVKKQLVSGFLLLATGDGWLAARNFFSK